MSSSRKLCRLLVIAAATLAPTTLTAQASPESPHGELSGSCSDCHSTVGWSPLLSPLKFDHELSTGFDLAAGHGDVSCMSCHLDFEFSKVASACADCHLDPHLGELGFACEACHTPSSWDARLDFAAWHDETLFPLSGAHRATDCAACHNEDPPFEFQLTPTECFGCHVDDYQNADINHVILGFSTNCEKCHGVEGWSPAIFGGSGFDHETFYPLRGAHAPLDCSACHADGFAGTPTDCYACHADDYNSTTDPDHQASGFSTMCEDCHGTAAWEGAVLDHTFFPLRDGHGGLDCEDCHSDGFDNTSSQCVSCHRSDYDNTSDPDHAASGISTMCEDCHNIVEWEGATIDHTFFALRDGHGGLDCEDCHSDGFDNTSSECVSCHRFDYDNTSDPDHAASGISTMCEDCHNIVEWEGATVDHTFFALRDGHGGLDCEDCHSDGFDNTSSECVSCHRSDYDNTSDPNHAESGFPTTCQDCHNIVDWEDANFDHDSFPLRGGHGGLDCEDCHSDGFDNTSTECVSCHRSDYDNTNDPDHRAAGFPTSCEDCHNINDWEDADFNHDGMYFPIDSGNHRDEWDTCADCHVVPSDFSVFECINCHEHSRSETDDDHDDVSGYVYESRACLECHPDGDD